MRRRGTIAGGREEEGRKAKSKEEEVGCRERLDAGMVAGEGARGGGPGEEGVRPVGRTYRIRVHAPKRGRPR